MKFREIQEACWTGYQQQGMKKKGNRQVPNCVPVEEGRWEKTKSALMSQPLDKKGQELAQALTDLEQRLVTVQDQPETSDWERLKKRRLLQTIGQEFDQLDRDIQTHVNMKVASNRPAVKQARAQGIKQAAIKRKHGDPETFDQRQQQSLKYFNQTSPNPRRDFVQLPAKTLDEYTGDPSVDMDSARELLAMALFFGVPFAIGAFIDLRNKLRKYQGREIIDALERKGVTMNRQTYDRVKPVLDQFDQAIRDDDGATAKALAKQIQQMIVMGKLSAPEPQAQTQAQALAAKERELQEDLKKWFKEKWVRFGPDGKIRGACARGSEKEGKPKCLPQSKAHALGKKGRASAAAKKRREDPNAERRGPARNVATKVSEMDKSQKSPAGWNIDDYDYSKGKWRQGKIMTAKDATDYAKTELDNAFKDPEQLKKVLKKLKKKGVVEGNNNDWDDADEFGMPGSEFFPDDDRLRDGDYVRDRQDGEYGEIFRMSGDPSERRVRILDRDGKGWYISPERLVAVDRTDPDIMRYFGKRRQRDMDESAVAEGFEYGSRVQHPKYGAGQVIKVYSNGVITVNFPNYPDPVDKKPGVQSNFAPGDNGYQSLKPMVTEKQDACYRKVKSRYKVWPSAYASGALVQCRKKGAANWGTGGKKK